MSTSFFRTGWRLLAVSAALVVAAWPAGAQRSTVDDLLRVARWRFEADFKADKAALDSLLADDLTYGRTSGVRHSKAEVLGLVGAGGPYALDYSTPDSLVARVYGETGVVTGLLKVKLTAQQSKATISASRAPSQSAIAFSSGTSAACA